MVERYLIPDVPDVRRSGIKSGKGQVENRLGKYSIDMIRDQVFRYRSTKRTYQCISMRHYPTASPIPQHSTFVSKTVNDHVRLSWNGTRCLIDLTSFN